MEAHFHYRVWQQEPWQMRLWRRIRFFFLSHAENTYQGGLKSWRSLFWHAQIREERAWAESRGRNVSNNTMQRQKREKNRGAGFFFLQLTIPQSAGISSDLKIYSKPDWQRRPMPCTEIRVYTRYPSKTLRKTISLSPPRNFPPLVTKFLPKRKTLASVPRTAHLSTQQKVCSYHVRGTSSKGQKRIVVHCKEKKTPRKIRECASSRWNERLSRLLLPPTVFTLLLRRFVRFTRFFLLLTSPHTPPSSFPPVRVITPLPPPVPSTPSVIRACACTAFGPCLPPPIKLQSCLTACPALDSFTQSGNARATAPLPSCQTATPLSGQDVTQRRL